MKITIVQGAFLPVPPLRGGAVEKMWMRMGQEFAASGHTVLHLSRRFAGLPHKEEIGGVQHIRRSGFTTPRHLLLLKVLDLIYSLQISTAIPRNSDIVISNTFWLPLLMRGRLAQKVYVDVQRVPRGQMCLYQHVGRLRACSPAIENAIRQEIPDSRKYLITYVPNPVPFDVPATLDLELKEKRVLFVGRLHPEKGVHTLISAWNSIAPSEWELAIVGPHASEDGGGGEDYLKKLESLSRTSRVSIIGPVYEEAVLKDWFRRSSIFCYPAQGDSGDAAPIAPREAMAMGCATVTSRLPCFSDFIVPGETGVMFDESSHAQVEQLASSLHKLMSNISERHRIARAGYQKVSSLAPALIAQRFLHDFERMRRQHDF